MTLRSLARGGIGLSLLLVSSTVASQNTPPSAAPPSAAAPIEGKVSGKAPELKAAVDALAGKIRDIGGTSGVAIVDVGTGELLAAHSEHKPFNPASNAKLMTAAAALANLRPSHRYETALYGTIRGGATGSLVLRGTGDPSLSTADLYDLARDLKGAGVKRVEGDILVDQRFFDESYVPPAFDQQPSEWAPFRAPVAALSVNENTVTMTVRPGQKGSPALVSFDPPGFVEVDGAVKTVEGGAAQNVGLVLEPQGTRLVGKLSGSIAEDEKPMRFTKRVDNPNLLAGYAMKAILKDAGITVTGEVKAGGENVKSGAIASHSSRAVSTLLYELGKSSDNFYAEMIFKSLGLEKKGRPAKSAGGAEVVTKYLNDIGAWEDGDVVKNGSGLFDSNHVTAATFAKLLRVAYRDPAIGAEYVAQLSIGGADGTLRHRFRDLPQRGIVRAKTGTLEAAAALSGYVLAPPGKQPVAFAILVNGVAGKVGDARQAMDKCVSSVASYLWE